MIVTVNQWGSQSAVRLPAEVSKKLGLTAKTPVQLQIRGNELIITKARRHISLEERFKDWNGGVPETTKEDREWLDMKPVGRERFWEED